MTGCINLPASLSDTAPALPSQWRNNTVNNLEITNTEISQEWWHAFGSAELDQLITTANTQNLDLASMIARARQAEAQVIVTRASLYPDLSGSLSANTNGSLDQGNRRESYSLGLQASYEVDFWGRNRAQTLGSESSLLGSQYDYDTMRLTVVANVATQWLQAVGFRERLNTASLNLDNAQRVLDLIEARARSGAATELELAQQRGLVAGQQRGTASLQQQVEDSRSNLALLLGQAEVEFMTDSLSNIIPPALPSSGLPSDLLIRRPDIARAETALVRADTNIIVARAAMLPRLSLSGGVSSSSTIFNDLIENPLYNLAANLTAPIFNAGRLRAQRDSTIAAREDLLASYQKIIISAFADVQKALNGISGLDAQINAQTEQLNQTRIAFNLAEIRYRAGADDLLTLLSSQTSLFSAEDNAAQLHQQRLQASVTLYRVLGGGWTAPAE